jgi:hypothetical protein
VDLHRRRPAVDIGKVALAETPLGHERLHPFDGVDVVADLVQDLADQSRMSAPGFGAPAQVSSTSLGFGVTRVRPATKVMGPSGEELRLVGVGIEGAHPLDHQRRVGEFLRSFHPVDQHGERIIRVRRVDGRDGTLEPVGHPR